MNPFSAMYFPTTTLFIDDDMSFLHQLTAAIDGDDYKICQDLSTLAMHANHIPQIHSIKDINKVACNPTKHEFVSTIVVDYQMNPYNGLEICKTIKNSPISKIMLTGIASKDKAIDAHNEDLIDFFVSKQDPRFLEKLNEAIVAGKRKYFARISTRINGFYNSDNPLLDAKCTAYLERELKDSASYYTWSDFNRLSALTPSNQQLDYMICSEENYVAVLDSEEAGDASHEIIKKLKDRTSMLWFEQTIPPGHEWENYIKDCTQISEKFYISKDIRV